MRKKGNQLIIIDTEILGGTPVFAGTRVPVKFFFDYIEAGETIDEFILNFPTVKKNQAMQLLETARKLIIQQVPDENFA
ncbi:MAG: DUF433 domain-containing protein [Bacteroidales bacterium]|nr:DUF433 domain-containing protein [Bacteroidales bacterium]